MSEFLQHRLKTLDPVLPSVRVQALHNTITTSLKGTVTVIDATVPECREKSQAIIALQQAHMWCMQALIITDDPEQDIFGTEIASP